MNIGIKMP